MEKNLATCHPNKPHYANGMCEGCYHSARFSKVHPLPEGTRRANCHPGLRHYAGGLCINCYQKEHPRDPQKVAAVKVDYEQRHRKERTRKNRCWFRENPGKERIYHLKSNYDLTPERFEEILKSQNYACALCHVLFNGQTPSVDHDHVTGIVRGLLCRTCNLHLGWLEKIIGKFNEVISYLERGKNGSCSEEANATICDGDIQELQTVHKVGEFNGHKQLANGIDQ